MTQVFFARAHLATKKECNRRERLGGHAGRNNCLEPTEEIVRDALQFYPSDDLSYDDWLRIGFALRSAFGDAGREIWEDWSAQSTKNDPETTRQKWSSFASVRSITIKTLYYYANQGGRRQRSARESSNAVPDSSGPGPALGKPEIYVQAGELPRAVDHAEEALIRLVASCTSPAGPSYVWPIYHQGCGRRAPRRIILVDNPYMRECMNRSAQFLQHSKKEKGWLIVDCPGEISTTFLARKGNWRIPVLTGITNCPTLHADGSLLAKPGYDKKTGLLFDPEGWGFEIGEMHPVVMTRWLPCPTC